MQPKRLAFFPGPRVFLDPDQKPVFGGGLALCTGDQVLAEPWCVDLSNLSDRDLQTLIREIDMSQLAVALKGASQAVKDKLTKNMSSRAAEMLTDDMGAMGPVRLAAVEAAQGELVKIAFGLAEQGRITIVGPADKMV